MKFSFGKVSSRVYFPRALWNLSIWHSQWLYKKHFGLKKNWPIISEFKTHIRNNLRRGQPRNNCIIKRKHNHWTFQIHGSKLPASYGPPKKVVFIYKSCSTETYGCRCTHQTSTQIQALNVNKYYEDVPLTSMSWRSMLWILLILPFRIYYPGNFWYLFNLTLRKIYFTVSRRAKPAS